MINYNDIYKEYRYIPNREEKNKEFSGLISIGDFFTSGIKPGIHINRCVQTEKFNKKYRALAQRNAEFRKECR